MIGQKLDFSDVRLCGKLCENFHSVAVWDTSCATRSLAKSELPAVASDKAHLKLYA